MPDIWGTGYIKSTKSQPLIRGTCFTNLPGSIMDGGRNRHHTQDMMNISKMPHGTHQFGLFRIIHISRYLSLDGSLFYKYWLNVLLFLLRVSSPWPHRCFGELTIYDVRVGETMRGTTGSMFDLCTHNIRVLHSRECTDAAAAHYYVTLSPSQAEMQCGNNGTDHSHHHNLQRKISACIGN